MYLGQDTKYLQRCSVVLPEQSVDGTDDRFRYGTPYSVGFRPRSFGSKGNPDFLVPLSFHHNLGPLYPVDYPHYPRLVLSMVVCVEDSFPYLLFRTGERGERETRLPQPSQRNPCLVPFLPTFYLGPPFISLILDASTESRCVVETLSR